VLICGGIRGFLEGDSSVRSIFARFSGGIIGGGGKIKN